MSRVISTCTTVTRTTLFRSSFAASACASSVTGGRVVESDQVGELDRGQTYAPKFPGATRRDFTRNRVKGPKFSGATRRNLQIYAPEDPPPDFTTHIKYVASSLFSPGLMTLAGASEMLGTVLAACTDPTPPTAGQKRHATAHTGPVPARPRKSQTRTPTARLRSACSGTA